MSDGRGFRQGQHDRLAGRLLRFCLLFGGNEIYVVLRCAVKRGGAQTEKKNSQFFHCCRDLIGVGTMFVCGQS